MKTLVSFFLQCIIFQSLINAQAPEIEWQKAYGGSNFENAHSIIETLDGGFIFSGKTSSNDGDVTEYFGLGDVWIVKTDVLGLIQWQKTYGGTNNEEAYQIIQTTDMGFIFTGFSKSTDGDLTENHGENDVWVVKLNEIGDIEWQKSYGGSSNEIAFAISQCNDGGFILGGTTSSNDGDVSGNHGGEDFWILKLNNSGDIVWQKCLGGTEDEQVTSISETIDSKYIAVGYSGSNNDDVIGNHGAWDFWVVKMDSLGNLEWQNSYGGTNYDLAYSLNLTGDGGFVILGYTYSNNGDVSGFHGGVSDYWVIKIDSIGNLIWQKCLGGSGTDEGFSIYINSDNEIVLGGYSGSNDGDITEHHGGLGNADYWIVKVDSVGNLIWQKSLGGTASDEAFSIKQTADQGYIIAGWAASTDGDVTGHHGITYNWDFWIVKLAPPCALNTFYADTDSDGFGDLLNDTLSCDMPIGFVNDSTDCNDANNLIYPTAEDICNTIDDNCNGVFDEDAIFTTWYLDFDADAFGDILNDSISCFDLIGYVINNTDCNDFNAAINPDAIEICDYLDNDCNFIIDDNITYLLSYLDFDNDAFGNPDIDSLSCTLPEGFVFNNTDCDDTNPEIYPGADEILNGIDDDCDEFIDEGLNILETSNLEITIYPNPTTNLIEISVNTLQLNHGTMRILDYSGRTINYYDNVALPISIDVKSLPSGVYLIAINFPNNALLIAKFTKMN